MKRPSLLVSLFCSLLLGCLGDDLSVGGGASLEREDVENLPPGDATGTDVSGAYLFTSFDQRTCSCRTGSEEDWCPATPAVEGIVLAQDEGALELRALDMAETSDELLLRGGIDADGAVVVGGVNTVTDTTGSAVGDTVNRVEGTIQPRDGGALQWTLRSRAVLDGTSVDCSMVFDLTVTWWDPDSIASCVTRADCHPERPFCVDDECTAGMPGDVCSFPSDCLSEACVDGACTPEEDCNATGCDGEQICFEGSCQDGVEGDGCDTPLDCVVGHRCTEATCYDGSEGDPCDSGVDCSAGSPICYMGACQDGSPGDPCDENTHCASLDCGPDGTCT